MGFKKPKSKLDSLQKCLKFLNLTLSGITQLLKFTFQQTYPLVRQDREVWCQRWKSSSVHLRWSLPVKASGVSSVKNPSWSSSHLPRKIGIRCEVSKTKSCSQFKVHESMAVKWKKRSEGVATIEVKTRQFGVNVPEVQSWSFLKFQKNEVTKPQQNQTKTKWSVPWLSTRSV